MSGLWWRLALLGAAAIAAAIPLRDTWVERLYASRVYARLQPVLTTLTNAIPIAILDLLIAVSIVWVIWRLRARVRQRAAPLAWRALSFCADAASFTALAYLSFLVLWGFNYRRPPADVRFHVDTAAISEQRLREATVRAGEAVNTLFVPVRAGSAADSEDAALAAAFARALDRLEIHWRPVPGRPKPSMLARLFPLGAVDGMMNPWGLEVLINPEVLPFERPFVVAHEWAHLAGNAAESDASFVAWLTCLEGNPETQYSGWLSIYLHLARALPPGERVRAVDRLAPGPRRDIEAIRQRLQRAHPWVQGAAWRAYDQYLRANRVESGIANYDAVTRLVLGSTYAQPYLAH